MFHFNDLWRVPALLVVLLVSGPEVRKQARAVLAQIFLGWALHADTSEVFDTVEGALSDAYQEFSAGRKA